MLEVALVGTGGMLPLPQRWLASALVRAGGHLVLFDCGEGTQISLRSLGWGIKAIDLILISHVHADHVAGLPGLLLTLGNSGRTEAVDIVGPPGVIDVVTGLRVVAPYVPFEVRCRELDSGASFVQGDLRVRCVAGEHAVACLAYRIDLARAPRFRPEVARALGVPVADWRRLQRGESVGGVRPEDVLGPPRAGLSVALVTDTRPTSAVKELVAGADLLVCEATFGDDADQPRAVERGHMTFREAAELALLAGVGRLVLTHFSPSVGRPEDFFANAVEVFGNTTVGWDHWSVALRFPRESPTSVGRDVAE
ncbi:MAG: ribonuclease Z [Chloroflexi bacterium]|nr:ribonuclease Z [Chloroflexota bacterium]